MSSLSAEQEETAPMVCLRNLAEFTCNILHFSCVGNRYHSVQKLCAEQLLEAIGFR